MIGQNVKLGDNVRIFYPDLVNIYGCEIGDDSTVAPFVEITDDVKIGKRCKISTHCYICSGVTIEDDVFVAHGVMFSNNLFPIVDSGTGPSKTLVGAGSFIGNGALIGPGVTIGTGAFVGMGACVIHDVPKLSVVAGNPAKIIRTFNSFEERDKYISNNRHRK